MSRAEPKKPSIAVAEPVWREEWIQLNSIVMHAPLQVRRRLDAGAVKRYRDMTKAGSEPPPIKVGRHDGQNFLVDGWHRVEADALVHLKDYEGDTVKVLVADLSEAQVRWEAAKANMGHGVPLKAAEYRNVLKAFIKAGKHRGPRGALMSYRDIGEVIGKGHTTVRGWIEKDFPKLFRQMGGSDGGNPNAEQPPLEPYTLADELRDEAMRALDSIVTSLKGLTPAVRWELVRQLDAARQAAIECGIKEPEPEPF